MAAQLKAQLDVLVTDFRNLQKEVNVNSRMRLQATQQLHENEMVQRELSLVDGNDGDNGVFKLVGPCLVKQDIAEARANIAKRLEFIEKEVSRADAVIASAEQKVRDAAGAPLPRPRSGMPPAGWPTTHPRPGPTTNR